MRNHSIYPFKASQGVLLKSTWMVLLPMALVLGLCACGTSTSTSGTPIPSPTVGASPSLISTENIPVPKLLGTEELEGLTRTNPFTPLLIDPNKPILPTGVEQQPATPVASVRNPFEGYSISGIIFTGKRPTAILSLPDNKTKIVHQGDTLAPMENSGNTLSVTVSKITKDSLTLAVVDPPENFPEEAKTTTLSLPTLIGYKSKSKGGTGGSRGDAGSDLENAEAPPLSGIPQELQNLLKEESKGAIETPREP